MAPRKDPDIGWKYGYVIDGNKQKSRCKFCGHENMSGGVSRLKEHLAGGFKNVKKCPNCPKVIREEIQILLHGKVIEKAEKEKRHKTFTEALFQPSRLLDDDDEDEDSYPPDCTTDYERAQHRLAVQNSMADRWDAEQQWRMNIRGEDSGPTVREVGGSSGGHRTSVDEPRRRGGVFMRSASARVPNPSIDPDMLRKPESRQKRLKESWNGGNLKKGLNKMMSKLFYYSSIPAHVASNNPYFQSTIDEIAKCGPGFTGPTTYELMHGLLDDEYNELQDYIKSLKRSWSQYGVTIMCDGWTGPTRLSIINFMVYCDGKTIFHKSVDASAEKKDANFIYKLMSMVVKSVGKEHVIQIVTDNGSAFLKAGKKMMERYHLFWTPCAAHCIDLMLKDIGNHASVRKVVDQARKITNYIYNHHWVLALMREKCGGDIIRPGITRFATNYIALKSILDKKQGLKEMFASREWANYDHNGTSQAREVEGLVARPSFWEDARHIVNALDPIVRVLRMVDGDKRPTMGSLYEAIRLMKENIKGAAPRSNKWILKIIDRRWTTQLCHPLHQAAFFLNPMYQYKYDASITPELQLALNSVIARLVPDGEKQSAALNELKYFRDAMGSFGAAAATSGRKITHPAEWWNLYGSTAPNLQSIAVKILSQTASSSGCERNWSTFGLIHTKQRNRLGHERLQKLVFVHYNMRLRVKNLRTNIELNVPLEPIDLTEIFLDEGDENPMYEWVKEAGQPLMDEPGGRPSSYIASEMGVDVDEFMAIEVGTTPTGLSVSSFNNSDDDEEIYHSSNGDDEQDGNGDDDSTQAPDEDDSDDSNDSDDDNSGGGVSKRHNQGRGQQREKGYSQSQAQMSPFPGESQFDHATQDGDHGSRPSSSTQKKYSRKKRGYTFESENTSVDAMMDAFNGISVEDCTSKSGFLDSISSSSSSSRGYPRLLEPNTWIAPTGFQGCGSSNYSFENIQPSGWILPTEYPRDNSSYSYNQSHDSQPSTYSHQRLLEYPEYPRLGAMTSVDQQTYEKYVNEYISYYSMMSWCQYCNYIEHHYYQDISNRSGEDEENRRSMWL